MEGRKHIQAAREFADRVGRESRGQVDEIILFGSAVTGGYHDGESDIDVLVAAKNRESYPIILDIQTEVNLKYDVALSILFETPLEIQGELKAGSAFMKEVLSKGVRLYENSG